MPKLNTAHSGDCIEGMRKLKPGSVQLAFADPPFNIGYDYDAYDDRKADEHYLDWSKQWMKAVVDALSPTGAFWLAIGDEYAAELKICATRELGLTCRSWVIWYYTFGVHCTRKFTRSHAHLFHFVKDRKHFTFNADEIRVPSARQLVYGDKRADARGRMPDDTWVLRPQDIPDSFTAEEDTWYFPRVCGTFEQRAGWHGCQMPEQLLGRIIRACSNPDDLVLDPFAGSGTTAVVAKKLGRQFVTFELSENYAARVRDRLSKTNVGDPLIGDPDPLRSAPSTANGRKLKDKPAASVVGKRRTRPTTEPTMSMFESGGPANLPAALSPPDRAESAAT
ncbi:MAG: site-specific DNA-methyltransferase [Planctomycetia bacterium]|nr:MAG: site-specific DNA-methyltransferase [Planctomycetia bacterium]